jgi:hypothetical protein
MERVRTPSQILIDGVGSFVRAILDRILGVADGLLRVAFQFLGRAFSL